MDTDQEDTSSTTSSNTKSHQSLPKLVTGEKSSGKITENGFNDKVVILTRAVKDYMRMRVAYGDVFPPTDAAGHANFVWDVIKQSSQSMPVLTEALREAATSEFTKRDLIKFMCFYLKLQSFSKFFSYYRPCMVATLL
jgi:hypothetical protein